MRESPLPSTYRAQSYFNLACFIFVTSRLFETLAQFTQDAGFLPTTLLQAYKRRFPPNKNYSTQNLAQIIPHRGDHWEALQDALASDENQGKL